jgi:hypothetical protein
MKTYWKVEVQFHVFIISVLDVGEWAASRSGRFSPWERAYSIHWTGGWVCPRSGWEADTYINGFDSQRGLEICLFNTASRTAMGPTQPPTQWVAGALSLGVKWPGREADHSPPSSAEIKNAWSYTSTPQYVFMAWYLVKHRDNFTFYIHTYVHTYIHTYIHTYVCK